MNAHIIRLSPGNLSRTRRLQLRRVLRRAPPIIVQRNSQPYWKERGWVREGNSYRGSYGTRHGSWVGRVSVSPSGRVDVYIHNPPEVLASHSHWECFRQKDGGWFHVHPASHLPDVSAGIIAIEKTINEAYEM